MSTRLTFLLKKSIKKAAYYSVAWFDVLRSYNTAVLEEKKERKERKKRKGKRKDKEREKERKRFAENNKP